ncbi:hypothetical protein FPV67DRAFT_1675340 [Lyophyllum atratum]|nr:hypothetical protein FPV67DRAFT_1675340 [Lyophyllum atratum]
MASSPLDLEYLALEVLSHLNIAERMTYSVTCHANRDLVRVHLLAAVCTILNPFFVYCWEYEQFWQVLTSTKGVLSGDLSLAIMQPLAQHRPCPNVLMLYIPRGATDAIATFFHAIGYEDVPVPVWHFTRSAMFPWQKMRAFRRSTIVVCFESIGSSVLPLVLTGPCTAVMNAVTATRLYMFYPKFTLNGLGIVGKNWPADYVTEFYAFQGIHVRGQDEYTPGVPCSYECRGFIRRIRGDRGMAVVTWNSSGDQTNTDGLESESFAWRLGGRCTNASCPYRFQELRRSARTHC